ncbi:MAG: hypothetical protein LC781_01470 [Actinobacteria bacterium]|nr:hypothetical protein [Actinomycetota bacterium]
MKKRLVLMAVSLAMLLTLTTALALAQTEPGASDELRCLLPEGCGPVPEDELLCLLPEGCDTNRDGVPDLRAGQPVPGGETGTVQYDNTA